MPSTRIQCATSPVLRSMIKRPQRGFGVAFGQFVLERQATEGLVVAGVGEADHRVIADEGQTTQVARAESQRLELPAIRDRRCRTGPRPNCAATAGPGTAAASAASTALMRSLCLQGHRAPPRHSRAGRASRRPRRSVLTAVTNRGTTFRHRKAVQMAAILRRLLAQERRPPQRREARPLRKRRNAAKPGGDEQRAAGAVNRNIVNIKIAGRVGNLRHVQPVVVLVELARAEAGSRIARAGTACSARGSVRPPRDPSRG